MALIAILHTQVEFFFKAKLRARGISYTNWLRERVLAELGDSRERLEELDTVFPGILDAVDQERAKMGGDTDI